MAKRKEEPALEEEEKEEVTKQNLSKLGGYFQIILTYRLIFF